jgi:hypothetical protein
MSFIPYTEFSKCVTRYHGERYVKSFSCMDQFLSMAFAQLAYRESLRDIEVCLRAHQSKLWHMGLRGPISRSTLADANENRDWRIWADLTGVLIRQAQQLYCHDSFAVELKEAVYAFDSTTISLCLSLFPWAAFWQSHAAIKAHTLLDLRGNIPCWIRVTTGDIHDVNLLDRLPFEPGAFYLLDRGYLDFERLYRMTQIPVFFVTRIKSNTRYQRVSSHRVDKSTGLRCDQTIILSSPYARSAYRDKLRLVKLVDLKTGKRLAFLTNNFELPALTISDLYRCRWQVELFFRWIKNHLRIKAFFGTSENAVTTQIYIAVSTYLLVAIMKKSLQIDDSLYTILQILSVSLFEKKPILCALEPASYTNLEGVLANQLELFDC